MALAANFLHDLHVRGAWVGPPFVDPSVVSPVIERFMSGQFFDQHLSGLGGLPPRRACASSSGRWQIDGLVGVGVAAALIALLGPLWAVPFFVNSKKYSLKPHNPPASEDIQPTSDLHAKKTSAGRNPRMLNFYFEPKAAVLEPAPWTTSWDSRF